MQLKSEVLPAPFGPISPQMLPDSTTNDSPSRAVIPPNRSVTSCTSKTAMERTPLDVVVR